MIESISQGQTDGEDSMFLSGGFDQVVRLWVWNDAANSVECAAVGRGHKEVILTIASTSHLSGCGADLFATGSADTTIKIWSSSIPALLHSFS